MSTSRKIARSIARQEDAYLEKHSAELSPKWRGLPREDKSLLVNMSRFGITPKDLEDARQEGRNEAYRDTAPAVLQVAYAAMGVVLHDEFGFEKSDILKMLRLVDDKIVLTLDADEIAEELEDKCGLRIRGKEGVGRVEETD